MMSLVAEVTLKAGSRIFRGTPSPMKPQPLLRNELLALCFRCFSTFFRPRNGKTWENVNFLVRKAAAWELLGPI